MMQFLSALFGMFKAVMQYFADKQLIDAGKAEEAVAVQDKVQENVQKASDAVSVPDAARTERLRNKYDRSRGK